MAPNHRVYLGMTFLLILMLFRLGLQKTVQNLGVLFDPTLCFHSHIGQTVKSCFFYQRNIVRMRPSLNFGDTETVVYAFITSRLHYCNSLYSGLPTKASHRLQMVQNSAA